MNNFIITSFYTLDTPYVKVAHAYLMNSLSNFPQIKTDIRGVENLGSWAANTSFKPTFILNMLEKHTENIVFIDADAEIKEMPILFETIPEEYNFAVHILDRNEWFNRNFSEERKWELLTGTLWVRSCERSKEIVKEWIKECSISKQWEQKVLQKILNKFNEKVYNLPVEYTWMVSLPNGQEPHVKPNGSIVIKHNQLSRQYKHQIN